MASWNKHHPCPICEGYGAGRKDRGMRCRGFQRRDGLGVYCEKPAYLPSGHLRKPINPLGFNLYFYSDDTKTLS